MRLAAQSEQGGTEGAMVIPKLKLVICSYPKGASTTAKWIMLRLINRLTPQEICKPEMYCSGKVGARWSAIRKLVGTSEWWRLWHNEGGPPWNGPEMDAPWADAHWLRFASNHTIREAFGSEDWTTVALVRDPWYRAISSYHDSIRRGSTKGLNPTSRDDFLTFTTSRAGVASHTLPGAPLCAMDLVKYDVSVAIERLDQGFARVSRATHQRVDTELLSTGWEECTRDGSPSLLDSASPAQGHLDHAMLTLGSEQEQTDKLLCNATIARAVYYRCVHLARRLSASPHVTTALCRFSWHDYAYSLVCAVSILPLRYAMDYSTFAEFDANLPYEGPHKCRGV
jgi:hypothetical protein